MSKTIKCPYCQTKLNLPREAAGQEVDCPECSRPFLVSRDGVPIATQQPEKGSGRRGAFRLAASMPGRVLAFIHDNQMFSSAVVLLLAVLTYCLFNRYDFRNIGGSGVVIDHLTGGGYNVNGKRIFIR